MYIFKLATMLSHVSIYLLSLIICGLIVLNISIDIITKVGARLLKYSVHDSTSPDNLAIWLKVSHVILLRGFK